MSAITPVQDDAPEAGEIRRARDVGRKSTGRVIAVACRGCSVIRWVQPSRIPPTGLCLRCSGRRTIHHAVAGNSKPRPYQSERQRGSKNPYWRGGVVRGGNGYRYVLLAPNHPLYIMAHRQGYAMEHRLIMAECLGRPLEAWEQVHHKNGVRTDNRLQNLELWKRSQPSGVRAKDYHCPGCQCFREAHHGN